MYVPHHSLPVLRCHVMFRLFTVVLEKIKLGLAAFDCQDKLVIQQAEPLSGAATRHLLDLSRLTWFCHESHGTSWVPISVCYSIPASHDLGLLTRLDFAFYC